MAMSGDGYEITRVSGLDLQLKEFTLRIKEECVPRMDVVSLERMNEGDVVMMVVGDAKGPVSQLFLKADMVRRMAEALMELTKGGKV
jgi:hypothetical protein